MSGTGYNQDGRLLRIDTPLGPNKALLIELDGVDGLSRPFLYRIGFVSDEPDAKVKELLGEGVTLWIGAKTDMHNRPIHGRIRRLARRHAPDQAGYMWHAEVVPDLWFLTRKADSRIWQDRNVLTVLTAVFQAHGMNTVQHEGLTPGDYPVLPYCVQYRETAFAFVSRLMEEYGLFYYHKHEATKHTMVISTKNSSLPKANPAIIYYGGMALGEKLSWLERDLDFRTGTWTQRDYNFEFPTANMESSKPTKIKKPEKLVSHEVFDYPGRYAIKNDGDKLTEYRIETEEAAHEIFRAGGTTKSLDAGKQIGLSDLTTQGGVGLSAVQDLAITEMRHTARDSSYWVQNGAETHYRNSFSAIPLTVPFRAPRTTPRPIVHGAQTATVCGKAGEEIHTDKYGRVMVAFHWDRNPEKAEEDKRTCWIRVSQTWAGSSWGTMHIPRIGHEVIVDFLEGDPDRPIIVGRVYNADNMPPWTLPDNKTQSGILTRSTPQGAASNANALRFEDKKGREQIWLHAEKNLDIEVENDETHWVGHDRTTTIDRNETLHVKGPLRKTTVDVDFEETVNGKETRTITGPITENVTNNYNLTLSTGRYSLTAALGVAITTPLDVTITSSTGVTVVAPVKTAVAPSWFKSGGAAGDAYGFKMGIAGLKFDLVGIAIGLFALKFDFAALKVDTFIMTLKKGSVEIKTVGLELKGITGPNLKKALIHIKS